MKKAACPKCREAGGDRSGDNMIVFPEGNTYCHKCGHKGWDKGGESPVTRSYSKLTVEQIQTYPIGCDSYRKLHEDIPELFGLRVTHNEETGKVDKVCYPYFDGETVTGYKQRKLPKDFSHGIVGKIKGFYGKQLCTGSSQLLIVEGEEDCHAATSMFRYPPSGITPKKVDVVSLPNGASESGTVDSSIMNELDFISRYKRVYLCLDNDSPGRKTTTAMGDWLAPVTEVKVVSLDAGSKDASDLLRTGAVQDFMEAIRKATLHEPEGVVNGIDILLDDLLKPMPEGYKIPFEGLQNRLHGVRKGEILTVCAGSGIGKSTLVREITKALIEQDCSVANIALEDQMNVAAQALIALDMDIPLSSFRLRPPAKSETQPHYDKMIANGKTFFYKHFGGLTSESLMNKLYYYARSKSCDFIVLDHLSMVISSSTSNNERKDIDTLMTNLAKMVVETGVGLIQIVHLKRTSGDKTFARGAEVELTDLRGSAALEQLSWAVVGLERDQQGDDRDFSVARVLKNRTFGFTGLADHLKFDPLTGRMASYKPDVPELSGEIE